MVKKRSTKNKRKKAPLPARKATRKPKKFSSRRLIFLGVLLGILLFLVFFVWIDSRVRQRLVNQRNSSLAAVYSDILQVGGRNKLSLGQFREELLARGYAEVRRPPDEAGQFWQHGETLTGVLRDFTSASGAYYPERPFTFPIVNTAVGQSITLEPRILAPLIAGDQQARRFKSLSELPAALKNAVVAIEDERFYSHFGIDLIGIGRAFVTNIASMSLAQGGSTVTQQLAKNTLFSRKRVLSRKILEAFAALSIELHLSKERILELYLNEVYLGQEGSIAIHGVGAASMTFFGKPVEEITLAEAALIAGMIQAPSAYSPRRHLSQALERRRHVLQKMVELNFISSTDRQQAELSKPTILQQRHFERRAPFFVDALRTSLVDTFDLEPSSISGLKVNTGIHFAIQECAERALSNGVKQIERNYPQFAKSKRPLEAGLLAIEPASGLVRAWVGGRSYANNQFDRITMGIRQAGSTVKPFLYLTALDATLNHYKVAKPTSILPDQPLSIQVMKNRSWEPENYDHKFRGDVTLRYALENSLNLPAVYVSQKVGIEALANTFERFKLSPQLAVVPSMALGSIDTTLYRLTAAFAALANGGRYVNPRLFSSILDGSEQVIGYAPFHEEQLASEDAVFVLTHLLKGVVERGTARSVRTLGVTQPAAGKTGTSNDARDAWFVGFTPTLATGVWVGFDDNRKFGLTGGKVAAPIWAQFMRCAENWLEPIDFLPPASIQMRMIDSVSGRLATDQCPANLVLEEAFVAGTEPLATCSEHPGTQIRLEHTTDDPTETIRRRDKPGFWQRLFN